VWVVLMAYEFSTSASPAQLDALVATFGRGVMQQLDTLADRSEARGAADALEQQVNRGYREAGLPSVMVLELRDRDGAVVHASTQRVGVPPDGPAGSSRLEIGGRTFHVFRMNGARWRLLVAQPMVGRGWILRSIASDLAVSMLIALPFVLLPLWFAVRQGLRPLNELSRRLAARDPDDLADTGLTPRHAELRPLVRSLDGLIGRLRGKVRREHAFVHDAAHELRTPMAVISAQAHVLAQARDAAARAEAAARLDDAISRASKLVEQLLQLARFDEARATTNETLDLARVAQQELALLEPQAFARGIELSLEAPDALPWRMELAAFRAILQNLVGNALRYGEPGGQVVVTLGTDPDPDPDPDANADADADVLRLAVEDDGPGIPGDQRERVFERFVRGSAHDVAGSGLGLAIVRQAAARLGGAVSLHDGLANGAGGRGCRFELTLPARVV
jgi:signal transduction histidine kinase